MSEAKRIYLEFENKVNQLGLKAVNLKGSDEYQTSLRKLLEYFKNNYVFYLLGQYESTSHSLSHYERTGEIPDNIQEMYFAVFKKIDSILIKKVDAYTLDKVKQDENSFFIFISRDIKFLKKHHLDANENSERTSMVLNKRDRILLKKIMQIYEALEIPFGSNECVDYICELVDISKERFYRFMAEYESTKQVSLDAKRDEEDASLNDIVSDDNYDNEYKSTEYDSNDDWIVQENIDSEVAFVHMLEKLNDIYRVNFFKKHRLVFPKGFTNDYINETVKLLIKPPLNFAQTVEEKWEELEIEYKRQTYANGNYLCIDDYIFCWFKEVRRQILSKEIADVVGVSSTSYTKIYHKALDIVKENIQ